MTDLHTEDARTFVIAEPGIYDIVDRVYHSDPVIEPSLSASIAKILLGKSPAHAREAHPRLNPNFQPVNKAQFDRGEAAHAVLLGSKNRSVKVIDAKDYKKAAAKKARDDAYADGHVPVLKAQWDDVRAMAAAARAQLDAHKDAGAAFRGGYPEQTLVWQEILRDGTVVWCRCKLDWRPEEGPVFYDYKSTSGSAEPRFYTRRQMWELGFEIQAGMYTRAVRSVLNIDQPKIRFVIQENYPPYALSVIELDTTGQRVAEEKALGAIDLWGRCMRRKSWPGYPAYTCQAFTPGWVEGSWAEREIEEEAVVGMDGDILDALIDWQAPVDWKK